MRPIMFRLSPTNGLDIEIDIEDLFYVEYTYNK